MTKLQRAFFNFARSRPHTLVLGAPGTGKTFPTLSVLWDRTPNDRALVIAPPVPATTSWHEDNKKFGFNFDMRTLDGRKQRHLGDEQITIITPDSFNWFKKEMTRAKRGLSEYKTLVIDEVHSFKTAATSRYKGIVSHVDKFEHRIGLTGTPTDGLVDELFAISRLIDGGKALGKVVGFFRARYMVQNRYTNKWSNLPGAVEEVIALMRPFTFSLLHESDSIPDLRYNKRVFVMPQKAREIYERLDKTYELPEYSLRVKTPMEKTGKLKQIVSGGVIDGNSEWVQIHDYRISELHSLITELRGQPLFVFYEFVGDRQSISDFLVARGLQEPPVIDGRTTRRALKEIISDFNLGRIPVLLGQMSAAGTGGNFQGACRDVCFFSHPNSLRLALQCVGRVWRKGQRDPVVLHQIMAEDTGDAVRERQISVKRMTHNLIFDSLDIRKRG